MPPFLLNPYRYLVAGGCPAEVISTTDLYAYYKFNGNVIDGSGNGNNAISTSFAPDFNAPYSGSNGSGWTASAWVKIGSQNKNHLIINLGLRTTFNTPYTEMEFGIRDAGSSHRIVLSSPGNFTVAYTHSGYLNVGDWYHIAVKDKGLNTTASNNYDFFINGVKYAGNFRDGSASWASTLGSTNSYIGGYSNSRNTRYSWGDLDDVSLWNRRLSDSEISTLYNSTCPLKTGCPSKIISTTSLGAYYKLDGNVTDSGPNGLNGTAVGSPTYAAGKYDDAISLNGSSQYVTVPDSAFLEGSGGDISVFIWVNPTSYVGTMHAISKWTATNGWRIAPRSFDILVTIGGTNVGRGSGVPTGEWTLIGFTKTGTTCKVYQNGAQVGTDASVGTALSNTQLMNIGKRSNANEDYFNGLLDDASVWQRVLTPAEISDLYNSTCPLKS